MTDTSRSLLTPEAQLVLLADGRAERNGEVRRLLESDLDWKKVLTLANRERSALPLWRTVRSAGADVERMEVKVLKRMAEIWEFKLLHLERLLFATLDAFHAAGVEAVLLKGAGVALSIYGGFTRRPMLDIDVLVPRDRAEEAWTLAQSLEWRWDAAGYPKAAYEEAHHLPPLMDTFGSGVGLEIHTALWMPDHPFAFSEADVLRDAVRIETSRGAVPVPRIEHQLLHCCIHFAWSHRIRSHAWRAFSDVRAFIEAGTIDWTEFVALARATGAETCCYWTLRLSSSTVGNHLPSEVLRELRPSGPEALFDRLERHFMLNFMPDDVHCPSLAIEKRLWRMAIQRGKGSGGIHLPSDGAPLSFPARVAHHAQGAGAWVRYLGRLA